MSRVIGTGKVFISHAHEDDARCAPLLAALQRWGVDYWFDTESITGGQDLSRSIQDAIEECNIFLRVCTPAAQRSYWVQLETSAFRALQARDHRDGHKRRLLVNLIVDTGYRREPFDLASLYIDATNPSTGVWMDELLRALGPATFCIHPLDHTTLPSWQASWSQLPSTIRGQDTTLNKWDVQAHPIAAPMGLRPIGVTILAILAISAGVLGLLGATEEIAFLADGAINASSGASNAVTSASGTHVIFSLIRLIISVLNTMFGVGLLRLRPWAWILGVALQLAGLVIAVIQIAMRAATVESEVLGMAINVIIVVYLFSGGVRQAFGRA